MKTLNTLAFLLLLFLQSFSQSKHNVIRNDLPQTVSNDFAKAVNYSWYYANNKDAFKAAIIPGLQRQGISSPFDIERIIQSVANSKSCRDMVLQALSDYTGPGQLEQILVNMDVPNTSAKLLAAYAYRTPEQTQNVVIVDKPITKTNIQLIKLADDLNIKFGDSTIFIKKEYINSNAPLTYGVITDVKKDHQNNPSEIMVYYKDKLNKGVYDDIALEDFSSELTPEKFNLLLNVLLPGRKISFKTRWVGSSAGYDILIYLKPISKNTTLLSNKNQ